MHIKQYSIADINHFPNQPGVYFFYNKQHEIIYVGKAKNLKKRVTSYFNKKQQVNLKTRRLVEEISYISFTLVNSEYEALLLENNLIKSNQPRYNILLKDDKTYPYLCITQEPFPRLIVTRHKEATPGKLYGPFTDLKTMYRILELAHSLYTIRTCAYQLSAENIRKQKFKVCLEYHIGRCQGPCAGLQSEEAYNQDITQIQHLLKGNIATVKKDLKEKMQQAAQKLDYKNAQAYKEKLEALDNYQSKSLVINPQLGDIDVCAIVSDAKVAYLSYLQVKEGAIRFTQNSIIKKQLDEADAEILPLMLVNFRTKYESNATEVLLNIPIETSFDKIKLTVPKIGDKKKLVELAIKNALFLKKEALTRQEDNQQKTSKTLVLLQQELQLKDLPIHIECFDNSNIQGTNPVAAMVVFKEGKPSKRDYRHFNIKTVIGPDDFASMREVVERRYKRLLEEKQTLPQLIIIDGGKGQLGAAVEALEELGIYGQVAIIGIAKRLEEIYYPEDSYPLHLSKKSPTLKLLQQIRDEAHRFAITFHRQKRSQSSWKSQLEDIPGIGAKTITTLLQQFKSVQHIKEASLETLASYVGSKRAAQIKAYLK
jgi:excinuclease ABC subunit C